jgi:hypothetical protein
MGYVILFIVQEKTSSVVGARRAPATLGGMQMRLPQIVVPLVFASCFFQLNALSKSEKELKTVIAGDSVTFDVGLNEIPQFSGGRVMVLVCPIDPNLPDQATENGKQYARASYTDTISNQKKYTVSVQIPGNAPDGVWEAFFSFALPNSSFRELRHTRVEFQVRRRQYSGVPMRAAITVQ